MKISKGRIVEYTISGGDAAVIADQRNGTQAMGNPVQEGDTFPAIVVQVFNKDAEDPPVNLKVFLDGQDDYWATSRLQGSNPGQWSWFEKIS